MKVEIDRYDSKIWTERERKRKRERVRRFMVFVFRFHNIDG